MSMTIDGKVASSHTRSHRITGKFKANGTWGLMPRSGFAPMAHPDWKFGDVLELQASPGNVIFDPMRVMWLVESKGLSLRDGEVYDIENPANWQLVPEPDD